MTGRIDHDHVVRVLFGELFHNSALRGGPSARPRVSAATVHDRARRVSLRAVVDVSRRRARDEPRARGGSKIVFGISLIHGYHRAKVIEDPSPG
eukprot:1663445-Rhodomonas_salina.5